MLLPQVGTVKQHEARTTSWPRHAASLGLCLLCAASMRASLRHRHTKQVELGTEPVLCLPVLCVCCAQAAPCALACLCTALSVHCTVCALHCLRTALSVHCPVCALHCLYTVLSAHCPVCALSCQLTVLSVHCPVCTLHCLCTVLSAHCTVCALSRLRTAVSVHCPVCALSCLRTALSVHCPVCALHCLHTVLSVHRTVCALSCLCAVHSKTFGGGLRKLRGLTEQSHNGAALTEQPRQGSLWSWFARAPVRQCPCAPLHRRRATAAESRCLPVQEHTGGHLQVDTAVWPSRVRECMRSDRSTKGIAHEALLIRLS